MKNDKIHRHKEKQKREKREKKKKKKGTSFSLPFSHYSSVFLFLPLGAGSSAVLEYVTVLVTTCLTLILPPNLPLLSAASAVLGE
jgi:hypothetical protein